MLQIKGCLLKKFSGMDFISLIFTKGTYPSLLCHNIFTSSQVQVIKEVETSCFSLHWIKFCIDGTHLSMVEMVCLVDTWCVFWLHEELGTEENLEADVFGLLMQHDWKEFKYKEYT